MDQAERDGWSSRSSYDAWGNETTRTTGGITETLSYDALSDLVKDAVGTTGQEQ